MLALEWNLDDALQARFEDGIEQGIERGIKQGIEQGIERGIEQGIEQGINSVALKLIRRGISFDEIHEDTGLPLQRIRELADENRDS